MRPATPKPASPLSSCLETLKKSWSKQKGIAGLWQDWPKIAGAQLAPHCQPLNLYKGILFVGASHPYWRQALQYNRPHLLANLRTAGHDIREIRIQQHHPGPTQISDSEELIWARHPSRIDVHGITPCPICKSPAPTGEVSLWGKCSFCRRQEIQKKTSLSDHSN